MKFKHILILTFALQASGMVANAQKKPITNDAPNHWGGIYDGKLSNDGKYLFYTSVINGSTGQSVLTATDKSWSKVVMGYNAAFTDDSRFVYYQLGTDTLVKFNLAKKTSEYILPVNTGSFQMSSSAKNQFIIYRSVKDVVLQNIITGKESRYKDVLDYRFDPAGDAVLLHTKEILTWVNLPGMESKIISRLPKVSDTRLDYKFDNSGSALALIISNKRNVNLYYYKAGMDSARLLVANHPEGTKEGTKLIDGSHYTAQTPIFTPDGRSLVFRMQETPDVVNKDTDVLTDGVDVWNYKDANLQSRQQGALSTDDWEGFFMNRYRAAVIPVTGGKIIPLDDGQNALFDRIDNHFALLKGIADPEEAFWNKKQVRHWSLVSLTDGHRISLDNAIEGHDVVPLFSPGGNFLTWHDVEKNAIISYEIATGEVKNISKDIPEPENEYAGMGIIPDRFLGVKNWFLNDDRVLASDEYDVWELDPKGIKGAVNLTGGYGRKNHIKLSIANDSKVITNADKDMILIGQDQQTMDNGFFVLKLGTTNNLVKCGMGPYNYYTNGLAGMHDVVKAKNANMYLVTRMSATDAPNYFVSKDLKTFTRLSDVQPQKDYNWMTAELIHWKMTDGRMGKGVLYKPENFDPTKKYPIIFHYYLERSSDLNNYLAPEMSQGQLMIPWYVSNGYLVFLPDISNSEKPGHIAESVLNSVVSAAKYLSEKPWVDSTKMGIQGHSFGGYETNVLLSRSHIFAAAQPSSAPSNLFSLYGGLGFGGGSLINFMEMGEFNMQVSLWKRPDLYREGSPILYLDKVTTPVLIEAGKLDGSDMDGGGVPFSQSVELFTTLRRLQKPVWLLEYNTGHVINDPDQALDFMTRQEQFFDHYLKGKPAPLWMTEGIDAKYKGLKSGLQLDTSGK